MAFDQQGGLHTVIRQTEKLQTFTHLEEDCRAFLCKLHPYIIPFWPGIATFTKTVEEILKTSEFFLTWEQEEERIFGFKCNCWSYSYNYLHLYFIFLLWERQREINRERDMVISVIFFSFAFVRLHEITTFWSFLIKAFF